MLFLFDSRGFIANFYDINTGMDEGLDSVLCNFFIELSVIEIPSVPKRAVKDRDLLSWLVRHQYRFLHILQSA